mgnify:CR=1 FL=1
MSNKFQPGDLIVLNEYGFFVIDDWTGSVGIIVSDSYNIVPQLEEDTNAFYLVYDVLINGELLKMVPQEFMEHYRKYEKDPQ